MFEGLEAVGAGLVDVVVVRDAAVEVETEPEVRPVLVLALPREGTPAPLSERGPRFLFSASSALLMIISIR